MPDGEEPALAAPDQADPELLNRFAWFIRWRSRRDSRVGAERVLDLTRSGHGPGVERHAGLAHRTLAWQAVWRGDFDQGKVHGRKALQRLAGRDAPSAEADVHGLLAVIHRSRGHHDSAREAVWTGLRCLERGDNTETRIDLLAADAHMFRLIGRIEAARVKLEEARQLASGTELSRVLHDFAAHHLQVGDREAATECAMRAVVIAQKWENSVVYPYALEVLGACLLSQGRPDRARDSLTEALGMARQDGDIRVECGVLELLGRLEMSEGKPADCEAHLRAALTLATRMNYAVSQASICRDLARCYEALGDLPAALRAFKMLDELRAAQRA